MKFKLRKNIKTGELRKRSVDESNNFFEFLTSVINSMGT